ncbi:GNAT family N-acetyltransferase [Halomonas sp. ANAO-440]|nr:GNAT family N-acetyltransferase [Halomonas sp. ANAO-440]
MKILPVELYGLSLRLIDISDAKDIASLRSSPELTKYMITLEEDVEKQKEWIRAYKKRESLEIDYYFAYENENGLIGYNRISKINWQDMTGFAASWIKKPAVKGFAKEMFLARCDVAFHILGLKVLFTEVHEKNQRAIKYWVAYGAEAILQKNEFITFKLPSDIYEAYKYGQS